MKKRRSIRCDEGHCRKTMCTANGCFCGCSACLLARVCAEWDRAGYELVEEWPGAFDGEPRPEIE